MNKISRRDLFIIIALAVLVGVLSLGSGKGKGKNVPADDRHKSIYEGLKSGRSRADTELICTTCHGNSSLPLPKNHPPKEQCLICHLLVQQNH
jgi:hypothetical protein